MRQFGVLCGNNMHVATSHCPHIPPPRPSVRGYKGYLPKILINGTQPVLFLHCLENPCWTIGWNFCRRFLSLFGKTNNETKTIRRANNKNLRSTLEILDDLFRQWFARYRRRLGLGKGHLWGTLSAIWLGVPSHHSLLLLTTANKLFYFRSCEVRLLFPLLL